MDPRTARKRIRQLYAELPPEPPREEDAPVEEWAREWLADHLHHFPPAKHHDRYQVSPEEPIEEATKRLLAELDDVETPLRAYLNRKLHPGWDHGRYMFLGLSKDVWSRIKPVWGRFLLEHIREWAEANPERAEFRELAEWFEREVERLQEPS